MCKIPWRRFIRNRRRTYASLHVQLTQLRLNNCIINVIVWISSTSSASLFNAFCLPLMLLRGSLPRQYVATPRHSFSGGQGRFTTRGDPVSWTGSDYSDGPANFSTSQNPPGGDGPRGAILFRDTGSATWQLPSQESVPSNWLLRLHGADCGLQFL